MCSGTMWEITRLLGVTMETDKVSDSWIRVNLIFFIFFILLQGIKDGDGQKDTH